MKLTDLIHKKRRHGTANANANAANSAKGEISISKISSFSVSKVQDHKSTRHTNQALCMQGFPMADGPFMPYALPMTVERVAALQGALRATINKLADAEKWTDDLRADRLSAIARQPAFTLADDLAAYRRRLGGIEAAACAAEVIKRINGVFNAP